MSRGYVLVLGVAGLCYAALGCVLRILPARVDALGGSAATLGLAVGAPALTAVLLRPLGGRAADRVGPRPIVLAGALVMAAGVLPAFADGVVPLIASRLLVGVGEGAMMAAAVLWLLRLAGPAHRGRALGHIGLANYAGLVVGPLLADALGGDAVTVLAAAVVLPLAAAAVAAPLRAPHATATDHADAGPSLLRATLRAGVGLGLVNIGYVALISFGTAVGDDHAAGAAALVVPVFAATVIATRLLAAGVPDRAGPARTLRACIAAEALGLAALAVLHGSVPVLLAVVVLAAGQALAVPALGLLALRQVEPARHGAAAGLFFSWFDAGVGLGGPLVGIVARSTGAATAVALAGGAVAAVVPVVAPPQRPRR